MIQVRPASDDDAFLVLAWRNDAESRAQSRNTEPVATEDHLKWFPKAIRDPSRYFLMGEIGPDQPVGYVRFETTPEGYDCGIIIAPWRRRQGLGRELFAAGVHYVQEREPDARFVSEIKRDNVASRRMVEAAGFRLVDEDEVYTHYLLP